MSTAIGNRLESAYTKAFYEQLRDGATRSAQATVPIVVNLLQPHSVVDIGCGDGTWLSVFQKLGIRDIHGIDGDYVARELLQIPRQNFQPMDLTKPFSIGRAFDLAISLEVAEHLPATSAPAFVESLTRLAPVVLFSAAIPLQGGTHHINEQWPDKWAALFRDHDYLPVDCIRKHVWQNDAVDWWYAQNTLLFARKDALDANSILKAEFGRTNLTQLRLVHPRNYTEALVPVQAATWGVKTSSRLFATCIWNFVRRTLYSALNKPLPPGKQNPPNFNLALQGSTYYGICKRPARD